MGAVRCLEGGIGEPLIWLHEPGKLETSEAHELLSGSFRLLACEQSPADELGLERFCLLASGSAASTALELAARAPDRITALVLESPGLLLSGDTASVERRLAQLEIPTLVLFGTCDAAIPPDHGARYRATMPDCYYVLVYKAGATIARDRPDAFAGVVGDFLERREAFVVSNQPEKLWPSRS